MPDVDIKYFPSIDFLFSLVRINLRSIIHKNEAFNCFEYNEQIENYVNEALSGMSSMMQGDLETLTKKFAGGIIIPAYLCIKNNISSTSNFLSYFEKLSGVDFFQAYEEAYGFDEKSLSEPEKEKAFKDLVPPGNYKLFLEFKKHADETKERLSALFNAYYRKFYQDVEDGTTDFMKQRILYYKNIRPDDKLFLLTKMLLIDAESIDPQYTSITLYPSFFYEIGWSQFRCKDRMAYVFGYLLEQQLESSHAKRRLEELRKILADDKRMAILKLLNKKKCYSTELAEVLQVSKPTISYHINKMLGIGILNMDFAPSNRVFLSLNKEALREILDDLYQEIIE